MTDYEDPPRLADAAPDARLGALFGAARADAANEAEINALAAKLAPALGAPTALAGRSALLLKAGAGVALIAIGFVGMRTLERRDTNHVAAPSANAPSTAPSSANAPSTAPSSAIGSSSLAPSDTAPPAHSAPIAPSSAASTTHGAAVAPSTPHHTGNPAANSVTDEASLLERARAALSSSPAEALQLTNEHAREFPRGVLAQEREVIAIAALRRLGRSAEAERRAQLFDRTYPKSAHQSAVDAARTP